MMNGVPVCEKKGRRSARKGVPVCEERGLVCEEGIPSI